MQEAAEENEAYIMILNNELSKYVKEKTVINELLSTFWIVKWEFEFWFDSNFLIFGVKTVNKSFVFFSVLISFC